MGFWGIGNGFLVFSLMKLNSFENTGREGYTAPKCMVFTVDMENYIAQGSSKGKPGEDEDYRDLEDY